MEYGIIVGVGIVGVVQIQIIIWMCALAMLTAAVLRRTRRRISSRSSRNINYLQGKHVAITGGSSGIGLAIAVEALLQGSYVSLIGFDQPELLAAQRRLQSQYHHHQQQRVNIHVADIRNYMAISEGVKACWAWRPIDVMICNAGVCHRSMAEEHSVDIIDTIVSTNMTGTLYTIKAALPLLKERSHAHPVSLVLMGSYASLYPWYLSSVYTCTKHALKGLAETLKLELLPYNIRVTLICPYMTKTPLFRKMIAENKKRASFKSGLERTTSNYKKGMVQTPEEVARSTLKAVKEGRFLEVCGGSRYAAAIMWCVSCGNLPPESLADALFQAVALVPSKIIVGFVTLKAYAAIIKSNSATASDTTDVAISTAHSKNDAELNKSD